MTLIRKYSNNHFPTTFNHFFNDDFFENTLSNKSFSPLVNVKESDNSFVIEVAAPGLNKEDFKISLENNQLIISSEVKNEEEKEYENYARKEFSYSSFKRVFNVSEKLVDGDKIKASYINGVLNIDLPKREEVKPKPARTIEIL